jgi:glycosyltransferase involved in cell wall biosynthesis
VAASSYILASVRLLSALRPDVLHAHEILSPASAALAYKRLHRRPIVATLHRGGLLGDIYKLQRRPFGKERLRRLSREIDSFVVISQEIDSELAAQGVRPEKRIFIPNGVDSAYFSPVSQPEQARLRQSLSLPREALIVVYVGRFVAEKRVDQLLTLWPEIRQAFPQAHLLLIGAGEEMARLQAMSGPGVQLTGQVDDSAPYLKAADLFVLPSSTEGLSVSMLEALSSGLPALVTAVGGAPDVIQHKVNGYLIPPDDLPALRQGLLTLLGDGMLREHLGTKGRECIMAEYSLDSVAEQLGALYQKLLAR